jgi:hypothetical protein
VVSFNSPEINPASTGQEAELAPRVGLYALQGKSLVPVKTRNSVPLPQTCSAVTILPELSRLQRLF